MNRASVSSVLSLLVAAFVFLSQSTMLVAQEAPAAAKVTPPVALPPWACDWLVTCIGLDGKECTTTGTAYGDTFPWQAEEAAGSAAEDHFGCCCDGRYAPTMVIGAPYQTSDDSLSKSHSPDKPTLSLQGRAASSEWVVKVECTGRKGGRLSKTSSGRTYCEALSNARAYVCKRINSPLYGGACRCCSSVVQRPICCQSCERRKHR